MATLWQQYGYSLFQVSSFGGLSYQVSDAFCLVAEWGRLAGKADFRQDSAILKQAWSLLSLLQKFKNFRKSYL